MGTTDAKICPHTSTCELFAQFSFQSTLRVWKLHYCEAEHTRCARYQLSSEGKPVPKALLPNGQLIPTTKPK